MLVTKPAHLEMLAQQCRDAKEVAFDTEARVKSRGDGARAGLDLYDRGNYITGFSVKTPRCEPWYVPLWHPDSQNFPDALAWVWPIIKDKTLGWNNLGFDSIMAYLHHGLALPDGGRDGLTMAPLENENYVGDGIHSGYALKGWCARKFGREAVQAEQGLIRYAGEHGLSAKGDIWRMPAAVVEPYACDDVVLAERAGAYLDDRFAQLGIDADFVAEYNDYRRLLTEIELGGLSIDWPLVEQYNAEALEMAEACRKELVTLAGKHVNPGSPLQMCKLLKLETTQKWAILRAMKQGNKMAEVLWRWRRWSKASSTFYAPFLKFRDEHDILHPGFRFIRTGRLSCFEPNFHATPHYSPEYKVKDVFTAPKGYDIALFDWSQAEMRLCAHYTQDPDLCEAFANGVDVHSMAAAELGLSRDTAKTINYGAAYGLGKGKLARDLGCSEAEAKGWLDKYHKRFTGPRTLYRRMGDLAEKRKWIRMWDGRYRRFDHVRNFPRTASNSLLQGGVGGMARKAMLRLWPWCRDNDVRMTLQIHDAIKFYIPQDFGHAELRTIKDAMEDFDFRVAIPVDVKRGKTWGSLKKVTFEERKAA